jgi:hypothetical protein
LTLQATRDLLKDDRIWCVAAHVALHKGEERHWFIGKEGQMLVSVLTNQHGSEIWAILDGGGRSGRGYWEVPAPGTELLIGFDHGEYEGEAYIVGMHGRCPTDLTDEKTIVVGDDIIVRTMTGERVELKSGSIEISADLAYLGGITGSEKTFKAESVVSAWDDFIVALIACLDAIAAATIPVTQPAVETTFQPLADDFSAALHDALTTNARVK